MVNLIISMATNRKRQVQMAETLELIRLYRANHCLWNPRSSGYMNESMKERSWQFIANYFDQSFTVDQIKRQIASLRYVFITELLTMKRRKMEGYVYIPHFKYFKDMEFLTDAIMPSVNEIWNIKSHLQFLKENISEFQSEAQDLINYIFEDSFILSCSKNVTHNDRVDHMPASFESNEVITRNAWLQSLNKADHSEVTPIYNLGDRNFPNRMHSGEDNRHAAAKPINYDSESDYYFESPNPPVSYSGRNYSTCNEVLPSLEGGATWDPSLSQDMYPESENAQETAAKTVLTGKYKIKPNGLDCDCDQRQIYQNIQSTHLNTRTDSGMSAADPVTSGDMSNDRYENCIRKCCAPSCCSYPYVQQSYSDGIDTRNRQGKPGQDDSIYENQNIANSQNINSKKKMDSQLESSQPMKDSELDRRFDNPTTNTCDQNTCPRRQFRRGEYENDSYQAQTPTKQGSSHPELRKNNLPTKNRNVSPDHGKNQRRESNNARNSGNSPRASQPKRVPPAYIERSPKPLMCTNNNERLNVPHADNLILCQANEEYEDGITETQAKSMRGNDNGKTNNTEMPPFRSNANNEYENGQTARQRRSIDEYRGRGYEDDVSKVAELGDMQNGRSKPIPRNTQPDFEEEFCCCCCTHDQGVRAPPNLGDIKFYKCCNRFCQSPPRPTRSSNNFGDFFNYRRGHDLPDKNFTRRYEDDYNRPNDQFSQNVPNQKVPRRRDDEYNRGRNSYEYPRERQYEPSEERGCDCCICMQKSLDQKRLSDGYRKANNILVPDYDQQPKSNDYNYEYAHPLASSPRQQEISKRNNYNQFTKQQHGNARRSIENVRDNPEDCCHCCECDSNCPIKGRSAYSGNRTPDDCQCEQPKRPSIRPTQNNAGMPDNLDITRKAKRGSADNQGEEMMLDYEYPNDGDEAARQNVKNLPRPDICLCEAAVETDIDMTLQKRYTPPQNAGQRGSEGNAKAGDDKKKNADEKDQPPVKPRLSTGSIKKPCNCKPLQKNKSKVAAPPGMKNEKLAKYRSIANRQQKLEDDPAANQFQARSSGKATDGLYSEVKNMCRCRSNVEIIKALTFELPSNYMARAINIVNNHVINDLTCKTNRKSSTICLVSTTLRKSFVNRMTSNPFIKIDLDTANKDIIVLHPPANGFQSASKNSIPMPSFH